MNKRLLSYIEHHLKDPSIGPMEQMIYITAKLSVISLPTAWLVKRSGGKMNMPFLYQHDAYKYLQKNGGKEDYVLPLFTTVKVDFFDDKIKDLLLTPLPEEGDKLS